MPNAIFAPMVGRDVLGAPRPRKRPRNVLGNTSCTRAAEDVGPYHVQHHVRIQRHVHTHGRARRPRRAAPTKTSSGTPRVRGPPGTSAPTTSNTMPTPNDMSAPNAMSAPTKTPMGRPRGRLGHAGRRDVDPYHVQHHVHVQPMSAPMVGRDVLGAPRLRGRPRDAAPTSFRRHP